jgi:hypothetical protein
MVPVSQRRTGVTWLTVNDQDWEALKERFEGLRGGRVSERGRMVTRSEAEMRRLFNIGLPSSPVSTGDQIRARTIVRERVREVDGDVKYNDPYFELEWMRLERENPELQNDARDILWNAYYARGVSDRQRWRRRWQRTMGRDLTPEEVEFGDT